MKTRDLFALWDKGHEFLNRKRTMTTEDIQMFLKPKTQATSYMMQFVIGVYAIAQLASLILLAVNIPGYASNATMQAVIGSLMIIDVLCLSYGARTFASLKRINQPDNDFVTALREKIRFLGRSYEVWLWSAAVSLPILAFSINILIDNQGGVYPINRVGVFVAANLIMIGFIYAVNKVGAMYYLAETKAHLQDLERMVLDDTQALLERRKRYRWLLILAFIACVFLLVLGILKALG
jgi:hypothetical protein